MLLNNNSVINFCRYLSTYSKTSEIHTRWLLNPTRSLLCTSPQTWWRAGPMRITCKVLQHEDILLIWCKDELVSRDFVCLFFSFLKFYAPSPLSPSPWCSIQYSSPGFFWLTPFSWVLLWKPRLCPQCVWKWSCNAPGNRAENCPRTWYGSSCSWIGIVQSFWGNCFWPRHKNWFFRFFGPSRKSPVCFQGKSSRCHGASTGNVKICKYLSSQWVYCKWRLT